MKDYFTIKGKTVELSALSTTFSLQWVPSTDKSIQFNVAHGFYISTFIPKNYMISGHDPKVGHMQISIYTFLLFNLICYQIMKNRKIQFHHF
jgi:hypothetical protein